MKKKISSASEAYSLVYMTILSEHGRKLWLNCENFKISTNYNLPIKYEITWNIKIDRWNTIV